MLSFCPITRAAQRSDSNEDTTQLLRRLAFGLTALLCSLPVSALAKPTYESLWNEATQQSDCTQASYSDFILLTCPKTMTFWYFTKPNHPAHPGAIKRTLVQEGGAWVVHEHGISFASDAVQPAFKAWLDQIQELDRQAKDAIARQQGAAPSTSR